MLIKQITSLPTDLIPLVIESEREGFRFLRRLVDDFETGTNTFSKYGEALFVVIEKNKKIAIGGVNIQSKESNSVGRIRRFYVSKEHRNSGIGKKLLSFIEIHAFQYFDSLVLFTDTAAANMFYLRCGYQLVNKPKITHIKFNHSESTGIS